MNRGILVVVIILAPSVAAGLECGDRFDYDDGTVPYTFVSTGDPDEQGAFAVQGGLFAHTQAGPAHYVFTDCPTNPDFFDFDVRGAYWDFAWRIGPQDPASGTCVRLSHDDRHGQWAYSLSAFSWESLDPTGCPECQWMWHHGTPLWVELHPTGDPAEGWHHVVVWHDRWGEAVQVWVDRELLFDVACEPNQGDPYQGFGCTGGPVGDPAFDNVIFSYPDPVERSTWGTIKGLYR